MRDNERLYAGRYGSTAILSRAARFMGRKRGVHARSRRGGSMTGFPLNINPDETDDEAAEILVDGTVDGRPYRFLLDTGAARTHLRYDGYTAVFPRVGADTSSGVFASGSDDLITAPSV